MVFFCFYPLIAQQIYFFYKSRYFFLLPVIWHESKIWKLSWILLISVSVTTSKGAGSSEIDFFPGVIPVADVILVAPLGSFPFWALALANGWNLESKVFDQGIQLMFLGMLILQYVK